MPVTTTVYIYDPVDYKRVFAKCAELTGAPAAATRSDDGGMVFTDLNQGSRAWTWVEYGQDGPPTRHSHCATGKKPWGTRPLPSGMVRIRKRPGTCSAVSPGASTAVQGSPANWHRWSGVVMSPVSDSARAAARIRGCLKTRGEVVPGGVVLWTEEGCGEWKADARELSKDLMLLGVPHFATTTDRCQPPWRSAQTRESPAVWKKLGLSVTTSATWSR
jgi:hypothetical protein